MKPAGMALAVLLVLPGLGIAEMSSAYWMSEADLVATFKGQSIDGHYENGDIFKETYAADGSVSYRDDLRASGGKWLVEAGTFCTIYDNDPAGGCYRVRREGENCFEFYFVARTGVEAKRDPRKPNWTARGWFPSKPSTCVDGVNV